MNEIFARRSIRKFLPTMVEDEKIEQLLRAAMAAPSAGNQQPWEFYVVRDKRVIQDLSQCSPYAGCANGAALAIVVCSRDEHMRFPAFTPLDLSAAVENILIEAVHLDLGAVWLGVTPYRAREVLVRRALGAPKGVTPFAISLLSGILRQQQKTNRMKTAMIHPAFITYNSCTALKGSCRYLAGPFPI